MESLLLMYEKLKPGQDSNVGSEAQKYMMLLVIACLLAGCQRDLTSLSRSVPDTLPKPSVAIIELTASENKKTLDEKPLRIDTLQYSFRARVSSINNSNNELVEEVESKSNEFYTRNNFQTKWLGKDAPSSLYYAFLDIIRDSGNYGLIPGYYSILSLDERIQSLYSNLLNSEIDIYELDAQITDAFFLFTTHLIEGRIKNTNNGTNIWIKGVRKDDAIAILLQSNDSKTLVEKIGQLHPTQAQYAKLIAALEQYRALENVREDFPLIYASGKISPNDVHIMIPLIRRKLELTDWKLDSLMIDSLRYDEALVSSVKWFQLRHGLEPDGIIGPGTLKCLNQSFKEQCEVIELNLERMRWLPQTYGDNYIIVNIPEYKMRVYENQQQVLEMKVIVGSAATATPIFSDTMTYIVFSPTWSVPNSIIRGEIIPRLQKDSSYYSGKHYTFFEDGVEFNPESASWNNRSVNAYNYSVVQQSGKNNSLGLVKFIMPNKMSIYLHDTPNHNLFNRTNRALSHGCVRLDNPDKLAEYLLKKQGGWSMASIDIAMHSQQARTVFLKRPYPVHIEYRTAWVDDNGLVNFREDLYGYDKKQLSQLRSPDQKIVAKVIL